MKTISINRKNVTIFVVVFVFLLLLGTHFISFVKNSPKTKTYIRKFNEAQDSLISAFEKLSEIYPESLKSIPYGNIDPSLKGFYNGLDRLVHLDLKGAPPRASIYKDLFPLFRDLGATGVLIEWEDMFPYGEGVAEISAGNAYTEAEVKDILRLAKENELKVIPLVQTFGHLEFVLKLEKFSHLRELNESPLSLSPTSDRVYTVLFSMIEQILKLHSDSKYIHLGCDEVYGLGTGQSGKYMKEHNLNKDDLFLKHVTKLANRVKYVRPDVTPIIWDDMLRHIPDSKLLESGIGKLIEPMVWYYEPNLGRIKSPSMWKKYGNVFQNVWIASSFKGATGPAQYITDATHHVSNHVSWAELLKKVGNGDNPSVHVNGVALTGWQRYHHFASLCELLPVAIPCLGLCLQTIKHGAFTKDIHNKVGEILKCKRALTLDLKVDSKQECDFPGFSIYKGILMYRFLQHMGNNHYISGWLNPYHVKHNFSSPWHLKNVREIITSKYKGFKSVEEYLKASLETFYDNYTVNEWLDSNLRPSVQRYEKLYNGFEAIMKRKHFPRRPLS